MAGFCSGQAGEQLKNQDGGQKGRKVTETEIQKDGDKKDRQTKETDRHKRRTDIRDGQT